MSTQSRLAPLLALTTLATAACDTDGTDGADLPIEFRIEAIGDLTDGPRRLNTNFLGLDNNIPFDHLPINPGAVDGVELTEIWTTRCGSHSVRYSTSETAGLPSIPIDSEGHLGTLVVHEVGNPANSCSISGPLWDDTHWEIRVEDGPDTYETDLRLSASVEDMFGYTAYRWDFNVPRFDPSYAGEVQYVPTCDENRDGPATSDMSFHSYLIPNFDVDATTGDRLRPRNAMFIACASGVIGKTNLFGYRHHEEDSFETATRMIGADYCGDGHRMTEEGTPIVLSDVLGVWSETAPVAGYVREAGWSTVAGRAICLDNPRRPELVGPSLACDGQPLPPCDAVLLSKADMVTSIEG